MKWEKIKKDDLFEDEVLAGNFEPYTHGYKEKLIGYLFIENDVITCESDGVALQNCTHFIKINDFDV